MTKKFVMFLCVLVVLSIGFFTGVKAADADINVDENQVIVESLQQLTAIATTRLIGQEVLFWKDGRMYEGVITRMLIILGNGRWSSRCMIGYSPTGVGPIPAYEFVPPDEVKIKSSTAQAPMVIRVPPECLIQIKEFIDSSDDYK